MLVYNTLTYLYDETAQIYNVDFIVGFRTHYACFLHNASEKPLIPDNGMGTSGGYIRIPEGGTFEVHAMDGQGLGDYYRSIFAASGGNITVTSEMNMTTNIINATPPPPEE